MKAPAPVRKVRCAVYTRKSSEEGLEQEFNSLDAQRDACESYIRSQRHEGWLLVDHRYDDGGFSGGTLERPALQRLLADVRAGKVDVVVVYKVDRLSRALLDFSKLIDLFDAHDVSIVSVTQPLNTATSMGRLVLNMMLSFAQFEREIIGERIRDKFAASRKRGIWMGGHPSLGYDVKDRKLVVNEPEAELVRHIFRRFVALGSGSRLVSELNAEGHRTKKRVSDGGRDYGGRLFTRPDLYKLLRNRVYIGEAVHKGTAYPGEHPAIVDRALWDKVGAILETSPRQRANASRSRSPALLKGLLFAPNGQAMTPTHTRKKGRLYRYYATTSVLKQGPDTCTIRRVPAGEIEGAVIAQVRTLLRTPELVSRTWQAVRHGTDDPVSEREVRDALVRFEELWDELFPAEQARILRLLVERVDVQLDGVEVRLRLDGLHSLIEELRAPSSGRGRDAA